MKHSNSSPLGPVMMVSGVILLVMTALLSHTAPQPCVFLGLSGIVLLVMGFRFLSGPTHILCPQCQNKVYIRNRLRRTLVTDGVLNCPYCGTILRHNSKL